MVFQSEEKLQGLKQSFLTFEDFVKKFSSPEIQSQKNDFLQKTKVFEKQGVFAAIDFMRSAGLSKDQIADDPEKRYLISAAAYLKPLSSDVFEVHFSHQLAENHEGFGEILPRTADEIRVTDRNGLVICDRAIRTIIPPGNREVYCPPGSSQRIFAFSGYQVQVIKTISPKIAALKFRILERKSSQYQRNQRLRHFVANQVRDNSNSFIEDSLRSRQSQSDNLFRPLESPEAIVLMEKLAYVAEQAVLRQQQGAGDFQQAFHDSALRLENGRYGCAYVASTILQQAGILNKTYTRVTDTRHALASAGWRKLDADTKPTRGCVVFWGKRTDAGAANNEHVGIVTGPNQAVDNHYNNGVNPGPKTGSIFGPERGKRSVEFWRPPDNNPKRHLNIDSTNMFSPKQESIRRLPLPSNIMLKQENLPPGPSEPELVDFIAKTLMTQSFMPQLTSSLVRAVIQQESMGDFSAVSPAGAAGIMQLMPSTATKGFGLNIYNTHFLQDKNGKPVQKKIGNRFYKVWQIDPRDERLNWKKCIEAGMALLNQLLKRYQGNIQYALAAYNWGSGNLDAYLAGKRNSLPTETRHYIQKISALAVSFGAKNL